MGDSTLRKMHLEPSISYGHIVTTVGMIVAGVVFAVTQQGRIDAAAIEREQIRRDVSRIEQQQRAQGEQVSRQLKEMREEQKQDNRRIEDKIDMLIERRLNDKSRQQ